MLTDTPLNLPGLGTPYRIQDKFFPKNAGVAASFAIERDRTPSSKRFQEAKQDFDQPLKSSNPLFLSFLNSNAGRSKSFFRGAFRVRADR